MEGSSASSSSQQPSCHNAQATDKPENEALPKQSEETQVTSLIGSNWPSLPSESGSPIPPGQKTKPENPSPSPWKIQQKNPEEYEKDRVGKYAEYFKGNPSKTRTQNRLFDGDGFKIKAAHRTKEGRVRGSIMKSRRPMPVLLQKEFRDMGRPAPYQRPSCQGCLEQFYNKVLPTAAGIPRHM